MLNKGACVLITFDNFKLAFVNKAANSFSVRSLPPVIALIHSCQYGDVPVLKRYLFLLFVKYFPNTANMAYHITVVNLL
jgi:hypothetical protein